MFMPQNTFRDALRRRRTQIGLWLGLADGYAAELLAGTGFDWLLVDGEHAPNDLRSVLAQLQGTVAYPVQPIVRSPQADAVLVKQLIDAGAQTLLVPMIETPEQAAHMVSAMRYPPRGIRGVGSTLAPASRSSQVEAYLQQVDEQMCLLVQIETTAGLARLESIAAVEGVDGVFFGPADLSASMGLPGHPSHPDVQAAILEGIKVVSRAGKAAGVLATDDLLARRYLDAGALFVAVGVDTSLLMRAASELAARFRKRGPAPRAGAGY